MLKTAPATRKWPPNNTSAAPAKWPPLRSFKKTVYPKMTVHQNSTQHTQKCPECPPQSPAVTQNSPSHTTSEKMSPREKKTLHSRHPKGEGGRGIRERGKQGKTLSRPPKGKHSSQTTYLSKGPLLTCPATTWLEVSQTEPTSANGMAVSQTHCDKAIETGHMCALEPKFPGRPWSNGACRGRPKAELRAGTRSKAEPGGTTRVEDPACHPVGC